MTKQRVLVVAHSMKYAMEAATDLFGKEPGHMRYTDKRRETDKHTIELAKFMDSLAGREYDRIWIVQQKKLLKPYSAYLISRLAVGGRFERYSE